MCRFSCLFGLSGWADVWLAGWLPGRLAGRLAGVGWAGLSWAGLIWAGLSCLAGLAELAVLLSCAWLGQLAF